MTSEPGPVTALMASLWSQTSASWPHLTHALCPENQGSSSTSFTYPAVPSSLLRMLAPAFPSLQQPSSQTLWKQTQHTEVALAFIPEPRRSDLGLNRCPLLGIRALQTKAQLLGHFTAFQISLVTSPLCLGEPQSTSAVTPENLSTHPSASLDKTP